jgi:riboflavin kinase / FMN adenylyltransferase
MLVQRDDEAAPRHERSVVAVGVFDGLHRGHQQVIAMVTELAREHDASAVVATFDPHPAQVLDPAGAPRLIGTLDQRLEGLDALGVDLARVITFDEALAAESAEDFVDRVLVAELRATLVVVGEDFRFGHERRGDVALLERLGPSRDYRVAAAPTFGEAERWSSTWARRCLAAGDVAAAAGVLGRPFVLRGVVERGDARGRELGFPTANLAVGERQMLPAEGVYAGAARAPDGTWWPAATSVGTRPQFYGEGAVLVETFLVGYDGDLYDANVDLAFLARIRDQGVFRDAAELAARIGADVEVTAQRFTTFSPQDAALLGW